MNFRSRKKAKAESRRSTTRSLEQIKKKICPHADDFVARERIKRVNGASELSLQDHRTLQLSDTKPTTSCGCKFYFSSQRSASTSLVSAAHAVESYWHFSHAHPADILCSSWWTWCRHQWQKRLESCNDVLRLFWLIIVWVSDVCFAEPEQKNVKLFEWNVLRASFVPSADAHRVSSESWRYANNNHVAVAD